MVRIHKQRQLKAYRSWYYLLNRDKALKQSQEDYEKNAGIKRAEMRAKYAANPEAKKMELRGRYAANPDPQKMELRARYAANPEPKRMELRARYASNPERKRVEVRARYAANPKHKKLIVNKWYMKHQSAILQSGKILIMLQEEQLDYCIMLCIVVERTQRTSSTDSKTSKIL